MKSTASKIMTPRPQAVGKLLTALGVAVLLAIILLTTLRVSGVSADTPLTRDFFGTVLSSDGNTLLVETGGGIVDVPVSPQTMIRIPQNPDATIADLVEGDRLAISLEEEGDGGLVADKIFLIPIKTQFQHIAGAVIALSDASLTVLPPNEGAEPLTFSIDESTVIRTHRNAPELQNRSSVVVVVRREAVSGVASRVAVEINVIPGRIGESDDKPPEPTTPKASGIVDIKGVLEGIDDNRNLIIDGTKVKVTSRTEIEGGLAVGKHVEVQAELFANGELVALKIEVRDDDQSSITRTRIEGVFQGIDDKDDWIVSGIPIEVTSSTFTDGRPDIGQRVRVIVISSGDALLAREIVNVSERDVDERGLIRIEGVFQGVTHRGLWLVSGIEIAVGEDTQLKGRPAVNSTVRLTARFRQIEPPLAIVIEGETQDSTNTVKRVELEGVIERIDEDGTLVINGVPVKLEALTEIDGELKEGVSIKVVAILQSDGSIAARIVESDEDDEADERDNVRIEGVVDHVNEDGSLVVNGIRITTDALSQSEGELDKGASVRIEGAFSSDGSVVAGELKGENRAATRSGAEVKLEGEIKSVRFADNGRRPVGIVVNDVRIAIVELTEVDVDLQAGVQVIVRAVINEGVIVARNIEARRVETVRPAIERIRISGHIREIRETVDGQVTGLLINGVLVIVTSDTEVSGKLAVKAFVELVGVTRGDAVVALSIKSNVEVEVIRRDILGIVTNATRDIATGQINSITVNGVKVLITENTKIKGLVFRGVIIKASVLVSERGVVAVEIAGRDAPNDIVPQEPKPTPLPAPIGPPDNENPDGGDDPSDDSNNGDTLIPPTSLGNRR